MRAGLATRKRCLTVMSAECCCRCRVATAEASSSHGRAMDDRAGRRGSALCALQGERPEIGKEAIFKLMDAIDDFIPTPVRALDKPFALSIEDTFSIAGRGTGEARCSG